MNQTENITNNCDGYTQVSEEDCESYKKIYFYVEKENKILFPFIYKNLNNSIMLQKCIIMLKKNEFIEKINDIKTINCL